MKEKREKFEVLSQIREQLYDFDNLIETSHWNEERKERHKKIQERIGKGEFLSSFVVDTGHPNGDELHTIFDNGMIIVQNERTGRLVTELIARPGQIKRYWENQGKAIPIEVYKIVPVAHKHLQKKWNQW